MDTLLTKETKLKINFNHHTKQMLTSDLHHGDAFITADGIAVVQSGENPTVYIMSDECCRSDESNRLAMVISNGVLVRCGRNLQCYPVTITEVEVDL
jgi:hypothetical protein